MYYFIVLSIVLFFSHTTYTDAVDIKILFKNNESGLYPVDAPKFLLLMQKHMPIFSVIKNYYDEFDSDQPLDLSTITTKQVFDCIVQLVDQFLRFQETVEGSNIQQVKTFFRDRCAAVSKLDILNTVDYLGEATNDVYKKFLEVIITLCYDEFKTAANINVSDINPYLRVKLAGVLLEDVLKNSKIPDINAMECNGSCTTKPTSEIRLPNVSSKSAYVNICSDMSEDGVLLSCKDESIITYYIDFKKKSFETVSYVALDIPGTVIVEQEGISSDGRFVYSLVKKGTYYFLYIYDLNNKTGLTKKIDIGFPVDEVYRAYILYDVKLKKFIGIFYSSKSHESIKVTFALFDSIFSSSDVIISTHTISNRIERFYAHTKPILLDDSIIQGVVLAGSRDYTPLVFDINSRTVYFGRYDPSRQVYFYEKEGKKVNIDIIIEEADLYHSSFIPNYMLITKKIFESFMWTYSRNSNEVSNLDYFKFFMVKVRDATPEADSFFQRLKRRMLGQKLHEVYLLVYDLLPQHFVKALRYMQRRYNQLHEQYTNILNDAWYLYNAQSNTVLFKNNIVNHPLYKDVSPEIKAFYNTKEPMNISVPVAKDKNKSHWYALQQWISKFKR